MTTEPIKNRAEEYIKLEKHPFFRSEVEALLRDDSKFEDLNDRFYTDLSFGTGGLRGVIGGGYNRMNPFTVKRATQGLANYIIKNVPEDKRIAAVSFDSRNYSDLFAEEAALVLAGNGIKTYLFTGLRPTPELSYAVRLKKACSGIMVTASHNPAEYNGYKVYWEDGAQVTPPHDKGIIAEVRDVTTNIKSLEKEEALKKGLLVYVDNEIDNPYIETVKALSLRPELIRAKGKMLKIVYTPLHGTGTMPVERVLSEMGIDVFTVPEQREADGDFPTVAFPNPEIAPAMDLSLKYARERKADLVLGTDPDADRLGIAVPDGGKYVLISGNQLGALLADYIFSSLKELGKMPPRPAFINTIVTTDLQNRIAESYGAKTFKVLTGFKYIGELIRQFEAENSYSYVFGGEESYGFLAGTDVRDKDAVSAALLTVEMALWNVSCGRSVLDHLHEIYKKYGCYQEILIDRYFKGESGLNIMNNLMKTFRTEPPLDFTFAKVSEIRDLKDGTTFFVQKSRKEKNIDLPPSDVLQFLLEDGSLVTVRPSGTEPKIKFYASCRAEVKSSIKDAILSAKKKLESIEEIINGYLPD